MNKFWKWMEESGNSHFRNNEYESNLEIFEDHLKVDSDDIFTPSVILFNYPKQLLIGYMIQYLYEQKKYIPDYISHYEMVDINELYSILKKLIEALNE